MLSILVAFKIAGVASMSDEFFLHDMLGNVELNVGTTNNHLAVTSYFANPSFKKTVLLEFPYFLETLPMFPKYATMFEPAIFVRRESRTYRLVTVIPVHISIIST